MIFHSRRVDGYDLKTCIGEGLDDALRDLLCFFGVYAAFRVIVPAVANCLRDQGVYLMLICQDDLSILVVRPAVLALLPWSLGSSMLSNRARILDWQKAPFL